eukprot:13891479-Ditylum_brightwellii.AAC.1
MIEYKQMVPKDLTLALQYAILSLKKGPSLMVCQNVQHSDLLKRAIENNNVPLGFYIYFFCGIESYIFGKYEAAASMVERRRQMEKQMSRRLLMNGMADFFDGLIFIAMARKTSDIKWSVEATNIVSKMESYAQNGTHTCEHKLLLLEAELEKNSGNAMAIYERAIAIAEKNELVHEQAIA